MGVAGAEASRAAFVASRMRVWAGEMGCGAAARRRSGCVGREGSSEASRRVGCWFSSASASPVDFDFDPDSRLDGEKGGVVAGVSLCCKRWAAAV